MLNIVIYDDDDDDDVSYSMIHLLEYIWRIYMWNFCLHLHSQTYQPVDFQWFFLTKEKETKKNSNHVDEISAKLK